MDSSNPKYLRILVIINGKKRLSAVNEQILKTLSSDPNIQVDTHHTTAPLNAINHVQLNLCDDDTVICVGGDGTCNEVLNGIILSKRSNIKLAILPDGTGNDFVRVTKGINAEFVERVQKGLGELIDVGKVSGKEGVSRYFLNIAGFGLDGKVVEIMDRQRANGFGGAMSYSSAIIRGFFAYKKPNIELVADGFEYRGKTLLVAFCNGNTYANGIKISPDSKVNDGKMEVCVFGDVSIWHYIKYLGKLKRGIKIDHPEVHYYQGNRVSVFSEKALAGQLDGEYHSFDQAEVELLTNKINLINALN